MKKIKYLLVAVIGVFLVTGCSSEKKLTCTLSETSDGMKMENTVVAKFADNVPNYLKMEVVTTAEDETVKQNWSLFVGIMDSAFSAIEETDGISVTTNNNEKKYSYGITYEIDLDKVSDEDLSSLDLETAETYEELKKGFEEQGYTCK